MSGDDQYKYVGSCLDGPNREYIYRTKFRALEYGGVSFDDYIGGYFTCHICQRKTDLWFLYHENIGPRSHSDHLSLCSDECTNLFIMRYML
jgi:hypothetical protein